MRETRGSSRNDVSNTTAVAQPLQYAYAAPLCMQDATQERLRELLDSAAALLRHDAVAVPLSTVIESYVEEGLKRWKPGSVRQIRRIAAELAASIGSVAIGAAGRSLLTDALADTVGVSARAAKARTLGSIWRHAQERYGAGPIPWPRARLPMPRARDRWLTKLEIAAFRRSLDKHEVGMPRGYVTAINLLMLTGFRVSEVGSLRLQDIAWSSGTVRLRDTKTGPRDAPLCSVALDLLRPLGTTGWACPTPNGGPIQQPQSWYWVNRIALAAGLDGVSPHVWRHTWITHALLAGIPIAHVGAVVGHSSAYMTERYGHLCARDIRNATDLVAERLWR